jgi:hypothetical protein
LAWPAAGLVIGDAELGRVLILAGGVDDELNAVAGVAVAIFEIVFGHPDEVTGVGVVLDDGVLWLGVRFRALEEDECDGAVSGGLPGD